MKCRVTVDIPDGEGWVEALGLGRDGPVQQFHTANVLRRIQKYMPYRTGATIKLTIAQTDTHVPEIVTDNPQARYLYYGMSKSGKSLNYTHTKTRWPGRAGMKPLWPPRETPWPPTLRAT